jgi:hypothetical protein
VSECSCGPRIHHSEAVPHWLYMDALERIQTKRQIALLEKMAASAKDRKGYDAVIAFWPTPVNF